MRAPLLLLAGFAIGLAGTPAFAQKGPSGAGDPGAGLRLKLGSSLQGTPSASQPGAADRLAIDGGYRLWRDWGVSGAYAGANRFNAAPSETLPAQSFGARSETYAVGIWKAETWLRGDRLSFSVGQGDRNDPFGFGVPSAARGFGEVLRDLPAVGLRAPGREVQTAISYFAPLSPSSGLGFSVWNRSRSGVESGLPDERAISIRFSTRF